MSNLDIAISIAKEVGQYIKSHVEGSYKIEEKSSMFDLVTDIDRKAEELIRRKIKEFNPTHKIIGEEGIGKGDKLSILDDHHGYVWIVDPIDGTLNFIHRLHGFTVSIALMYRKEIILGVVYDPCLDEIFWAEKGKGSYRNNNRLTVSEIGDISKGMLSTGFPSDIHGARAKVMEGISRFSPICSNIRSYGSAVLHLAYVASGRLEGFWEYGLNVWDIAAGYLLVVEAGGDLSNISGEAYTLDTRNILASNGTLHSTIVQVLNQEKG